ncbi:MAG: CTP synthase [Lachnospiraceae bacterium]|nr:CTP synthase [Lachnospiraceae bacterium]
MIKYVFVTGGVVSGLGKGITAASLGRLLKARGYKVTMQKFDPYINVDPGTMNPIQHGEVFVTDDGTETDLDLGHYERFIDESLDHNANVTSGKIYWSVLNKERHGDYGGGTVQVIPHITNEIKSRFFRSLDPKEDRIAIIEVGGTVGDIESQPFLEAIRQFQHDVGRENAIMIHVTLIPYLRVSGEMKTKPTQTSVKKCLEIGIQPDILVCRSEYEMPQDMKDKIALFCNVPSNRVIQNLDAPSLYAVPLMMEDEHLADAVLECLHMENPEPTGLAEWREMVEREHNPKRETEIAIVGKYTALHDAYLSVVEALAHGGIATETKVNIRWVDSEEIEEKGCEEMLAGVSGILVPGGFGNRGTEGMIMAASYARKNQIPYLGICLGMQMAVVAFARDVLGFHDANSTEFAPDSLHPVIALMDAQKDVENLGGTMRLGAYPCRLKSDSLSAKLYGTLDISERHRHRYEFNNDYRDLMNAKGLETVGVSPDDRIVEMVEYKEHPFYVGTQAHPEFKSRPNKAHPLFRGLVQAAVEYDAR